MMMRALEAGGMDAAFSPVRDKLLGGRFDIREDPEGPYSEHNFTDSVPKTRLPHPGYKMNPDGFYELLPWEYRQLGFPSMYEEALIKVLVGGLAKMVAGKYEIVFMRRPYAEIAASWDASTGQELIGEDKFNLHIEYGLGIARQRRDMRLKELWYGDVLKDPLKSFSSLRWPIKAKFAAYIVNPKLYRHRAA